VGNVAAGDPDDIGDEPRQYALTLTLSLWERGDSSDRAAGDETPILHLLCLVSWWFRTPAALSYLENGE
jgi:hypothetical protein